MRSEEYLLSEIRECNASAQLPSIDFINTSTLDDIKLIQETVDGSEEHRLKTFLAILLMRVMRDFTDTDKSVYKSHNAVTIIVGWCKYDRDLRKLVRAQIRRCLSSPTWQTDAAINYSGRCVYCGEIVVIDDEGFGRVRHLKERHPDALPVEGDEGIPFGRAHIYVARDHLLKCLAGLVRRESWDNHRRFFRTDWSTDDFNRLESIILHEGNALELFTDSEWVEKGKILTNRNGT